MGAEPGRVLPASAGNLLQNLRSSGGPGRPEAGPEAELAHSHQRPTGPERRRRGSKRQLVDFKRLCPNVWEMSQIRVGPDVLDGPEPSGRWCLERSQQNPSALCPVLVVVLFREGAQKEPSVTIPQMFRAGERARLLRPGPLLLLNKAAEVKGCVLVNPQMIHQVFEGEKVQMFFSRAENIWTTGRGAGEGWRTRRTMDLRRMEGRPRRRRRRKAGLRSSQVFYLFTGSGQQQPLVF